MPLSRVVPIFLTEVFLLPHLETDRCFNWLVTFNLRESKG